MVHNSLLVIPFCFVLLQELLMSKLCENMDSTNTSSLVNFAICHESHSDVPCFYPLYQFEHVGKNKLEQVCPLYNNRDKLGLF